MVKQFNCPWPIVVLALPPPWLEKKSQRWFKAILFVWIVALVAIPPSNVVFAKSLPTKYKHVENKTGMDDAQILFSKSIHRMFQVHFELQQDPVFADGWPTANRDWLCLAFYAIKYYMYKDTDFQRGEGLYGLHYVLQSCLILSNNRKYH